MTTANENLAHIHLELIESRSKTVYKTCQFKCLCVLWLLADCCRTLKTPLMFWINKCDWPFATLFTQNQTQNIIIKPLSHICSQQIYREWRIVLCYEAKTFLASINFPKSSQLPNSELLNAPSNCCCRCQYKYKFKAMDTDFPTLQNL